MTDLDEGYNLNKMVRTKVRDKIKVKGLKKPITLVKVGKDGTWVCLIQKRLVWEEGATIIWEEKQNRKFD